MFSYGIQLQNYSNVQRSTLTFDYNIQPATFSYNV